MVGKPLTARQRRKIERAVDLAEDECGLQFCVYVGPGEEDMHGQADRLMAERGLADRPAVLVLVAPPRRHFEIVVSPAARRRISDPARGLAAVTMASSFAVGDIAGGIAEGVRLLAQYAGSGAEQPELELPDVLYAEGA